MVEFPSTQIRYFCIEKCLFFGAFFFKKKTMHIKVGILLDVSDRTRIFMCIFCILCGLSFLQNILCCWELVRLLVLVFLLVNKLFFKIYMYNSKVNHNSLLLICSSSSRFLSFYDFYSKIC